MDNQEYEKRFEIGKIKRESSLWIRHHIFYVVVFIASLLVLVFFPMIGSSANGWAFSKYTASDWVFYIGTKVMTAILNLSIFYSFCKQGEINVRDNPRYKEAIEICYNHKDEEYKPLSPKQWKSRELGFKGTTLFLATIGTLFVFTDIILNYDWLALISYAITILFAIIFGLIEMSSSEDYYTHMFYDYAKYLETKLKEEAKKPVSVEDPKPQTEENHGG